MTVRKEESPAVAEPCLPDSFNPPIEILDHFLTSPAFFHDLDDIEVCELEDLLYKHGDCIGLTPNHEPWGKYKRNILELLRWIDLEGLND